jgi:hypothetical protein
LPAAQPRVPAQRAAAITLTFAAGPGTTAGFNCTRCASSMGLPGFVARCFCCSAKGTGGGGGAVCATTASSRAGGLASATGAPPCTLCCTGATVATCATGARSAASLDSGMGGSGHRLRLREGLRRHGDHRTSHLLVDIDRLHDVRRVVNDRSCW